MHQSTNAFWILTGNVFGNVSARSRPEVDRKFSLLPLKVRYKRRTKLESISLYPGLIFSRFKWPVLTSAGQLDLAKFWGQFYRNLTLIYFVRPKYVFVGHIGQLCVSECISTQMPCLRNLSISPVLQIQMHQIQVNESLPSHLYGFHWGSNQISKWCLKNGLWLVNEPRESSGKQQCENHFGNKNRTSF